MNTLAWVTYLDPDERVEMFDELTQATRDHEPLQPILTSWRITAQALSDPRRRKILLGDIDFSEFEDAPRPEHGGSVPDAATLAFIEAFDPVLCARLLDCADALRAVVRCSTPGSDDSWTVAVDGARAALERLVGEGQASGD